MTVNSMQRLAKFEDHGPDWAQAVASLAERTATAFSRARPQGCLTILDLEPWRLLDAWWLRRRLEAVARHSGRPMRCVPCDWRAADAESRRSNAAFAPAWCTDASPVAQLEWSPDAKAPRETESGNTWQPDGPVLVLAGAMPKRLEQLVLLSHHGDMHDWYGETEKKWRKLRDSSHDAWLVDSVHAYARALPSAMLSLPVGYWQMLQRVTAWAAKGCVVLARAEGWTSVAQMREDAGERVEVQADSPPVNFHWIEQQASRIHASTHTVRASRADSIQVVATGLEDANAQLEMLCASLADATRSTRGERVRAVRASAAGGDLEAAMSVLQQGPSDPAVLHAAWDTLQAAAESATPAARARLGEWLAELLADNPWMQADPALLRATGHLGLACGRLDLARASLQSLHEKGRAASADLIGLARCMEKLSRLKAALGACEQALARNHGDAAATRERILARVATMAAPWRVQHDLPGSPLLLDPLHADHAPMLHRQMRDPTIASMTALPPLEADDDGTRWIQARIGDGVHAYAIVHRELGFVGYLDMREWDGIAFVCYWIGPDFQGRGLCAPALAIACDLAQRNGTQLLLSCAYKDNLRSLSVLRKQGFRDMDVRALPPDSERIFVMLPAQPMDEVTARRRLVEFCESTHSGLRFEHLHASPSDETQEPPLARCLAETLTTEESHERE